ncbi:TPA: hypothetical protein ACUNF5_006142 [Burkholderia orbicola]|uniref:Uncharacterized protein n=1 Tax=Burkholderia cenocepacia TaxID=95486 RepID=A0AAW4TQL1_9BURK|nr:MULTISPECIES: hypothetical protein [Burkholderia cepacia complex]MBR8158497.1 hypothetical protein [Burkholderia cenocepacia]MCA8383120.1 hypothetical protein [Burkholderia cenocepacia]MDF3079820.1 hypothetical protein [Burkholderia sola]MEB2607240.1 hypothetical protein [Burkholderia cenocepacia]RQV14606.1 hypothetical protein DF030_34295 [Burkholderia cenocepacia]
MKIFTTDKAELMTISSIESKDADLLIKGKIFGAMPMSAVITPEQARLALRLLTPRLIWFLLSLPFKRTQGEKK